MLTPDDTGGAPQPRGYTHPCQAACGDSGGDSLRADGDGGGDGSVGAWGRGVVRWTGTELPLRRDQWLPRSLKAQVPQRNRGDAPVGEGSPSPRTPRGDSDGDPSPCDGDTHSWLVARSDCDGSLPSLSVRQRCRLSRIRRLQPTRTWLQPTRSGALLTAGVPQAVDSFSDPSWPGDDEWCP